ncbi:putative bifunctional diguanylate cyclase/phosphodiesterase [Spongisporangium articulatum]|uniref:Bifunctional diguanylate cyclase/phosphodiesterase n=1 Tax=Spongisporangium articulatum TaxID=3362603 RepID=A0ABW8AGT4_9ACTN
MPGKARLAGPVWWTAAGASAVLVATVLAMLALKDVYPRGSVIVDDLGETGAAAWGALGCAWGAWFSRGRHRVALAFLAAAAASWACGQAVWSLYEVVLNRASPFPSMADVGYLLFLPLAVVGVWLLPSPAPLHLRRRQMLDAAMVAVAVTLLSSSTTLGAVIHAGADSPLAFGISIAYPIGDILLISATVLALGSSTTRRLQLGMVTGAMISMTLADSAFAYLTATSDYGTGSLVDVGWCVAFCTLGLAGITAEPETSEAPDTPARRLTTDLLPYALAALAGAGVLYQYFSDAEVNTASVLLATAQISLVLFRQYLALVDNMKLNEAVAEREEQLRHLAFHDDLTGLANRPLFVERVTEALARHAADEAPSVAFIDLDGFKWVNDTLGHAHGDELLVSVARRLQGALQPGDTLARLGGDEFAVLFTGFHEPEISAAQLVDALRTPFHVAGQRMRVSASVGVARLEEAHDGERPGAAEAGTLLQRADIAMFMVKRAGKNNFQQYSPGMGLEAVDDLTLQHALTRAIDAGEISVAYQPVMDLASGRLHGLEALARWQYEGMDVAPDVFVPTAERIGRAGQLTALVLDQACSQMAVWNGLLGHRNLTVAVNISPAELADPTLPARVGATLHRHGVDGRQLTLEVTEAGLLGDRKSIHDVLATLRGLNVSLALDDFGTGYNTLAQLLTVQLDTVKIDRLFVQDIDRDPQRRAFLEAMFSLLSRLGVVTVAEGVERPEQIEVLRSMGCTMAQGFLLGRPYSGEDMTPLVVDIGAQTPPRPAPQRLDDGADAERDRNADADSRERALPGQRTT